MRNVLAGFVVCAIAATASAAETIAVPKEQGTIQAAVNAAAAGDTIVVARGVYAENVVVPIGKDGLVFRSAGAVIDGNLNGVQGVCLTVGSANVAVTGFTFRNGGDQLVGTAANLNVTRCTFVEAGSSGVDVTGDGAAIQRCTFDGAAGVAVKVAGNLAVLRGCAMRRCGNGGLDVTGLSAIAERNSFDRIDDSNAVKVNGDACKVARNRFTLCDKDCIRITGITSLVEGNRGDRISARLVNVTGGNNAIVQRNLASFVVGGINVDGSSVQVLSNRVTHCSTAAAVSVSGDNVAVSFNIVNLTWNDSDGVSVDSASVTGGGTIEGNRVTDASGHGMRLETVYNLIVKSNVMTRCADDNRDGFRLVGNANTVTRCSTTDCDDIGFYVDGTGNSLTSCTTTGASAVGFLIAGGSGNALTDCSAVDCGLEGLDNQAFLTNLVRGRYRGARFDITNDVLALSTFTDPSLSGVGFRNGGSTQQSQF